MPVYTENDLMSVGQQLAEALRTLNSRVEAMESRPAADKMNRQWNEGRRFARSRGISGPALERMEAEMVQRGVASHADMMQLRPRGGDKINVFGGLEKDEIDALMNQDDQTFLDLAIPRSLAQAREE